MHKLIVFSTFVFTLLLAPHSTWAAPLPFAVVHASYDRPNSQNIRGGLLGSAFFISPTIALSAAHLFTKEALDPLPGDAFKKIWLVQSNTKTIEVKVEDIHVLKDFDLVVIRFKQPVVEKKNVYPLSETANWNRKQISSLGYKQDSLKPIMRWERGVLKISQVVSSGIHQENGSVIGEPKVFLKSNDVNLKDVPCLNFSFGTYTGMSGGPTLSEGKVVGVNSFGFPADVQRKTSAWSVYLNEERKKLIYKTL